jgi:hypothetical protein
MAATMKSSVFLDVTPCKGKGEGKVDHGLN